MSTNQYLRRKSKDKKEKKETTNTEGLTGTAIDVIMDEETKEYKLIEVPYKIEEAVISDLADSEHMAMFNIKKKLITRLFELKGEKIEI